MLRKLVFVGMIIMLMASFTVVLADQDGNDRWCNSDQYGCWVTDEEGGKCYIMFWSESARDLFMGPGSNAVVTDPYPAGKMPLQKAPGIELDMNMLLAYAQLVWDNGRYRGYESIEELIKAMTDFYSRHPEYLAIDYKETQEHVSNYPYCSDDGFCFATEEELEKYNNGQIKVSEKE